MANSAASVITCRVHEAGGGAIAGARVFFAGGPGSYPDVAALTNETGEAILAAPQPGTYQILVVADGFAPRTEPVTVSGGEPVALDLALERG